MTNKYLIIIGCILFTACGEKQLSIEEIIDKSVEAYGGQKVLNSVIDFDFRDKHYVSKYHNYRFSLKREFVDSTGQIIDELTNDGFSRTRNDTLVSLDEEWTGKYSRSVNSVIYFFRIPFVLQDPAVIATLLGSTVVSEKEYYKLKVSFTEEGGGEDYDDSFVYWINKDNFLIDYFAYSYSTDGGGKRFRKAINMREVNGLRVVDYINYKPKDISVSIDMYDQYFFDSGLVELSRIENRNVSIEYLQ